MDQVGSYLRSMTLSLTSIYCPRIPLIAYGVHTATTLIPILGEILFVLKNTKLALIYCPYFLIPLALAVKNSLYEDPFPSVKRSLKTKRR